MKCEANHENQNKNDIIKLVRNTEHNLGYIYFLENLSDEKSVVKPLPLYINYEKVQFEINNENLLMLDIIGKL